MGIATGIVVAVVVLTLLVAIYRASARNTFVRQADVLAGSWREVDTELQRRHECSGNLIAAAQRAGAVAGTEAVAQLRFAHRQVTRPGAEAPMARSRVEQTLTGALTYFFQSAANHPRLAGDAGYQRVCWDLAACEESIAAACRSYNGKVKSYNARFDLPPSSLVRPGHRKAQYFEFVAPGKRALPVHRHHLPSRVVSPRGAAMTGDMATARPYW